MRHAMLLNPFSANPEQAPIVHPQAPLRAVNRHATRSTPVCTRCESDDIISYVTAQWSNEAQEWQLTETFGQPAHCNECNAYCSIVWLPLN